MDGNASTGGATSGRRPYFPNVSRTLNTCSSGGEFGALDVLNPQLRQTLTDPLEAPRSASAPRRGHAAARWLAAHHADRPEVWLRIAKSSRHTTLTIGEALEVALCYGWIDSQRKSYDDDFYLQR